MNGVHFLARTGFRLLDAAAPSAAARLAADLFTRPFARSSAPAPEVPGLPTHRFTLTGAGERLAVWDWGSGPTVLLAHGWNGNAAQMAPFVAPLVRAGYFVAALDLPAHGSSTGSRATVVSFAEAIADAGRRLGPVHAVIGHSLGGTGLALAFERGLKADRAVLLASPADMPPYARRFAAAMGLSDRTAQAMIEEIWRRTGGKGALDVPGLAPRQKARLLVLHDPADREVSFEDGERIVRAWPGARLDPMPGRGHTRILRDPEAIRRAVDFVRDDDTSLPLAG